MPAHSFTFDPTYGYDRPALEAVPPAPEVPGFADFWRETFAEAAAVRPEVTLEPSVVAIPGREVFEIAFNSFGGVRIHGWLTLPAGRNATHGIVIYHGYGGRTGPDPWIPVPDAAAIFPCARGLTRSRLPGVPDASDGHVLHGIESRETYIHRGCTAEIWAAASALLEVAPDCAGRLDYVGGSFGGGIGALGLPWDGRFRRAFLSVPSFGQYPLRLQMPCTGSGEAVRRYARTHPEVADVLAWFDASTAAMHLKIPTMAVPALFDPAVPPPGQFAVANALTGPRVLYVRDTGHFEYPGLAAEDQAERDALARFLQAETVEPGTWR